MVTWSAGPWHLRPESPHGQFWIVMRESIDGLVEGPALGEFIEDEQRGEDAGVSERRTNRGEVGGCARVEERGGQCVRARTAAGVDNNACGEGGDVADLVRSDGAMEWLEALHLLGQTERRSIAFTVTLLTDAAGAVTGIAAAVRDETQRWSEEQELRRRLRELDGSPDAT